MSNAELVARLMLRRRYPRPGTRPGGTLVGVPPVVATTASVFVVVSATFLVTLAVRPKANADRVAA